MIVETPFRIALQRLILPALLVAALLAVPANAARITVVNADGPGEGLNDPTVVTPVAGNPGTTLGDQRLNALQSAANYWASKLSSSVEILLRAAMDPLACQSNAAVLGSAGAGSVFASAGLPLNNTWYPVALASSYSGFDLCAPGSCGSPTDDILSTFNVRVDETAGTCSTSGDPCTDEMDCAMEETCGCLVGNSWWYGVGGLAPPNTISLYDTALHELGHGLGFATFVDIATGAELAAMPDVFETHLEDHASGMLWPAMTDMERMASAVAQGDDELHWVGDTASADCGYLDVGADGGGHIKMYSPSPLQPGSSVSHWDTSLFDDELMEPSATLRSQDRMTTALFEDIGWYSIVLDVRPAGDVNASGFDDLAVLATDFTTGAGRVFVVEGASGAVIGQITTLSNYFPVTMEIVENFGGSGADEVAVLMENPFDGTVKVVVKDLSSGALLSTVFFGANWKPVDIEMVRSYGQTAAQEIAFLGKRRGANTFVRASMRDASNGTLLNHVFFPSVISPVDLEVVASFGGTGEDELAVLGRNCAAGNSIVDVRDVSSGAALNRVSFDSTFTMLDLEVVSDITNPSGTTADEVVVLGRRSSNRKVKAWVMDAQNGFNINTVNFPSDADPIDIEIVPDFGGGTTADEIALLARNEDRGTTTVKMRDASSGGTAGNLTYWDDRNPRKMTVLDDVSGNNVAEIGLIVVRESDNQRRAHIRDAANAATVFADLP